MLKVDNIFSNFTQITMKRYSFIFIALISFAALASQAGDPGKIVGVWKSPDDSYLIKIDRVGDYIQGRIVWLSATGNEDILYDVNNPNEQLRSLPLKGNKVIQEMTFNKEEARWEGGTFYNHTEGKLYNCHISISPSDQLRITKYVQNQQEGKMETWTRKK